MSAHRIAFSLALGLGMSMLLGINSYGGEGRSQVERRIQRGEYLVMHVAMCVQCHTPRDEQGNLNERRLLQGAPVPVRPPFATLPWAVKAPGLAGLPGWEAEEIIQLLQTGKRPDGHSPKPPMPPFRMTREDAESVVAYLKSLEPKSP